MTTQESPWEGRGQQSVRIDHFTKSVIEPPGPDFDKIPAELKALPHWLCWKFEQKPDKPDLAKVPKNARTGWNASTTNLADWCDFETAVAAYQRGSYSGIGFVFTRESRVVGIDLDECIDPDTGELAAWSQEIVAQLDTFIEVSPSGKGLHAYAFGAIPQARRRGSHASSAIEIYDHGRYFAVTGWQFTAATEVTEQQDALIRIYRCAFGNGEDKTAKAKPDHTTRPDLDMDDSALIEKAMAASNGSKFRDLWNGDTSTYGGDDSAADLALCQLLAFWTGKDASRMDRLFRQSGLMRPKWDSRRGERTYGQLTINKAIAECREIYTGGGRKARGNGHDTEPPNWEPPPVDAYDDDPQAQGAKPEPDTPRQEKRANDSEEIKLPPLPWESFTVDDFLQPPPEPPFLIAGYHPMDVSTTNGTGGAGKSTLWLYQCVHIILGRPLWDMEILTPGSIVYVTAEDGKDRLKWRLFHIMDQIGLTRSDRQQVAANFHIVNLVGTGRRLAALDKRGNIVITSLADQISEEAQPSPLKVS